MKLNVTLTATGALLLLALTSRAGAADGTEFTGRPTFTTGHAFYGDPPDERHAWCVHDQNRPQVPKVAPLPPEALADKAKAPAGAVILFDGTEASIANWIADKDGTPTKWIVNKGAFECVPKSGYVRTKQEFGDCQLHVEWAAPTPPQGESQGRGNSGIFLFGQYEIQVLDNYDNPTYADGTACAMYAVNPPKANALRPPGEFQYIDIEFRHAIYENGQCVDPGYITVYCNGILVQDHTQLEGPTGHKNRPVPKDLGAKGPFKLQDHGNPVRFRNIWIKELPPRQAGVKVNGPMSAQEVAAKRKEIAALIRADAAKLTDSFEQMLRTMESLVYEVEPATLQKSEQLASAYVASLKALPADQLAAKKDKALEANEAFKYLAKFKMIPETFAPKAGLEEIIKAQKWGPQPKAGNAKGKGKK